MDFTLFCMVSVGLVANKATWPLVARILPEDENVGSAWWGFAAVWGGILRGDARDCQGHAVTGTGVGGVGGERSKCLPPKGGVRVKLANMAGRLVGLGGVLVVFTYLQGLLG